MSMDQLNKFSADDDDLQRRLEEIYKKEFQEFADRVAGGSEVLNEWLDTQSVHVRTALEERIARAEESIEGMIGSAGIAIGGMVRALRARLERQPAARTPTPSSTVTEGADDNTRFDEIMSVLGEIEE